MHCSSLKQHLYLKNIEPDPHCICGGVETTEHFLLYCKNYERIRRKHFHYLNINISTNLLLFGNKDMNDDFNELEPQGALIAHLSTMSTSVIS